MAWSALQVGALEACLGVRQILGLLSQRRLGSCGCRVPFLGVDPVFSTIPCTLGHHKWVDHRPACRATCGQ